ncbi:MAG: substrate-binding domain-containing protein [Gammaproteobacteria bacterium]|nr:substrate-binding domain-containing protein [Gammaproteobacteria bacterium]
MCSKYLPVINVALWLRNFIAVMFLLGCFTPTSLFADEQKVFNPNRTYIVGFAQDTMSNDWRAAQVRDVEVELSKYPFIKFIYSDAKGSAARQALDLERFVTDGVDVIITSPRDANIMAPVISRIYKQGIPIILLTRKASNEDYTAYIGADDYDIGRQAAKYLAARLNNKGRVVMLKGVATATTSIKRTQGFVNQVKQYPGIEIVAEEYADYRRNNAIKAMEKILSKHIKFDAVYAQSDSMATGARMVMKKFGIDPKSKIIIGIDYIDEARKAIISGEQSASFTYPTAGKEGAETAVSIIKGEKVEKNQNIDFRLMTKDGLK